jgi:MFS family permease
MSKDARSRWPYVFMSAFLGTAIEQYDFLLYGTASALVFSKIFFPNLDPLAGTIASLGTYAAGYFARGAGALICGHFGDRIGRKTLLLATLMVMGVASTLVGLLPTYAMIGIWAPVLLTTLRVFQGFAIGGEPLWGTLTIAEIAYQNGFNDSAHFSRSFRASYGMSPSEFRKSTLSGRVCTPSPRMNAHLA